MDDFSKRRRQRFISEAYYEFWSGYHREAIERWSTQLPKNGTEDEKQAVAFEKYLKSASGRAFARKRL